MAQIENMSRDEQITEIHTILESATDALAQAGDNAMMRAMRFPQISTTRKYEDDLADSLNKLRQLATALDAIGNNPMFASITKSLVH